MNETDVDKVLTDKVLIDLLCRDMEAVSDIELKKYTKATFRVFQILDSLKVESKATKNMLDILQEECKKRDLTIPEINA